MSLFVTHVEPDRSGTFLRFFGQTNSNEAIKIEANIRFIVKHQCQPVRPDEVQVKLRCLTRYEDGEYYRAQIIRLVDQTFVSVFFIDYGNTALVKTSELLSLHSTSEQALYLMGTSPQANEYILSRIVKPWTQEELKSIRDEICNDTHQYHIEDKVERIPIIGVLFKNFDYSQYLIDKRKIGAFISVKDQKETIMQSRKLLNTPLPKTIPDKIDNISNMKYLHSAGHARKPIPTNNTNPFFDAVVETPKTSPGLRLKIPDITSPGSPKSAAIMETFGNVTLTEHMMYEVMCSHIEDGYRSFYIQLKQKDGDLKQLQADLARTPLQPLQHKPRLGMACIARHDKNGHLYRGIITMIKPNSCVVSFVDYGYSRTIPCGSLFEIPHLFMRFKMFAVLCSLDQSAELGDALKDVFHYLVINRELRMKVMPSLGATCVTTCELYVGNSSNIMDELKHIQYFGIQYQPMPRLSRDFKGLVIVRYVDTPKTFYVQPVVNIPEHNLLMDELSISCQRKPRPLVDITPGTLCAVSWDNDVDWYRGRVVDTKGAEKVAVRLVDYGKVVDVPVSRVQQIGYQFTQMPPQVYECCIMGFENVYDVTESSANAFEMLVETADGKRKRLKMQIINFITDDKLLVNLFDETQMPPVDIARSLCRSQMPYKDYLNMFEKKQSGMSQRKESFGRNDVVVIDSAANFSTSSDVDTYATSDNRIVQWNNGISTPDRAYENLNEKLFSNESNDRQRGDKWNSNDKKSHNNNIGDKTQKRPYAENSKGFERRDTQTAKVNGDRGGERGSDRTNDRGGDRSPRKNTKGGAREARPYQAQNNHVDANDKDWNVNSAPEHKTVDSISLSSTDFKPIEINFDTTYDVVFTYWLDPEEFYVQMKIYCPDYEAMLKEIQDYYAGKKAIGTTVHYENGWCVIARNSRDELLHRAKVCDYNKKLNKYKVLFVDRGYRGVVTPDLIWPITEAFMKMPPMAIRCSLANNNVTLDFDQQNIFNQITNYVNDTMNIRCKFNSVNDKIYGVTITVDKRNLLQALVHDGLVKEPTGESSYESSYIDSFANLDLDVQLLVGQTIYVKLMDIENLEKFQIMLQNTKVILSAMYCNVIYAKAIDDNIVDQFKTLEGKFCPVKVTSVDSNDSLRLKILTSIFLEEPPILCHPTIFQTQSIVMVAHMESLNVIYIHKTENSESLAQQLDEMYEFYNAANTDVCNPDDITLNKIMAVKSADENWYRGMVVNINGDDVTVKYIDYGNDETVKMSNLRLLNEKFSMGIRHATRIFLPLERIAGTGGEDSAFTEMVNMISSADPVLKILKRYRGEWIGELSVNGNSLAGELEKKGLAKLVNAESIFEMIDKAGGLIKEDPIDSDGVSAFVTHIISPSKFYLQEESIQNDLLKLQEDIQIVGESMPPLNKGGKVGDLCLGKYTVDNLWYRAQIVDSTADMTTLHYIDFGNLDLITDSSLLRQISDAFADIKPYARLCSLPLIPKGHEDDWSRTAVDIMIKLYQDQPVKYTMISEKNKDCYVHLYTEDGTSVEKLMLVKSLADPLTIIEPHSIGFVSHINSLEDFYMQMEKDTEDLEKMFNTLREITTTGEDVKKMEEGRMYAALFPEDNSWYRAKLIHSISEGLEVLFVDYGNTCITSCIKDLPKTCAELPIMSKKCCLEPPMDGAKWSEEAQMKFRELAKDGQTCFEIVQLAPGETAPVRLFLDGINVVDLLQKPKTETPSVMEETNESEQTSCFEEEQSLVQSEQDSQSQHEENLTATCSHINSIDDFYLHLTSSQDDLDRYNVYFASNETSLVAIPNVDEGILCCARFPDDGAIYRAKIEAKEDGNNYRVFFIDYGNTSITSEIWKLPDEFKDDKPLAIQCRLKKNTPGTWTDQALNKFVELVYEKILRVVILDKTTTPPLVQLFIDDKEICLEDNNIPTCNGESEDDNSSKKVDVIAKEIVENSLDYLGDSQIITEELIDSSISKITDISNEPVEAGTVDFSDVSSYNENSDSQIIQNGTSDALRNPITQAVPSNGVH